MGRLEFKCDVTPLNQQDLREGRISVKRADSLGADCSMILREGLYGSAKLLRESRHVPI